MTGQDLASLRDHVASVLLDVAHRIGRHAEYAPGTRLFSAGQSAAGIHLILSGTVRIVREREGRAVVMHRESAGGLLGEVAFFDDGLYPGTAIAAEQTRVLLLPGDALRRELRGNGDLAALFLSRLARRTREIIGRFDSVAHSTVLRRVARHLVDRHAATRGAGRAFSLGMTLVELAEELGTVKEVVVRELRALRRLRLIEPAGRGLYRVADLPALRGIAGAG